MSFHTQLPIYKAAQDLYQVTLALVKNMRRDLKPLLGHDLHRNAFEILIAIGNANAARDKVPHIERIVEHAHRVSEYLRQAHDMHVITPRQWAKTIVLTQSVGKQANGWKRNPSNNTQRRQLHDRRER